MYKVHPVRHVRALTVQVHVQEEPLLQDHLPRAQALHGGAGLQPQVSHLGQDHHIQGESLFYLRKLKTLLTFDQAIGFAVSWAPQMEGQQ